MRTSAAVVLATAAMCGLPGCGGGGSNESSSQPSSGPSTTATGTATDTLTVAEPTQRELAQQYLRIVGPANAEAARFQAKANSWNDSTTGAQAAKDAAPIIAAIQKADDELLQATWPAAIRADIKELVRTQGALIGDLQALETLDALSASSWVNQFAQDSGKVTAAARIVRSDLGLPPSKQ